MGFQNNFANSTIFTHNTQFNSDVKMLTKLTINSPVSTTGCLIIKDSGGLNSSLIIENSRGGQVWVGILT